MHVFLVLAARHLNAPLRSTLAVEPIGELDPYIKRSASTFTTFGHLAYGAVYLSDALPLETKLSAEWIDDAAWGKAGPMRYDEIAHVLIPRFFQQDTISVSRSDTSRKTIKNWNSWEHEQDIIGLSDLLTQATINHRLTEWALEVKHF